MLDVGCGTGLNFPRLQQAIRASGRIIGLDASPAMLTQAGARLRRSGWTNVTLICGDASRTDPVRLRRLLGRSCDAVLATYALSLMPDWRAAWQMMLQVADPSARLAVADMQEPTDVAPPLVQLARLACWSGGADITAHPWTASRGSVRLHRIRHRVERAHPGARGHPRCTRYAGGHSPTVPAPFESNMIIRMLTSW